MLVNKSKQKPPLKLSGIDKDFLLMKLFKEVIFASMYYTLNSKLFYPLTNFVVVEKVKSRTLSDFK